MSNTWNVYVPTAVIVGNKYSHTPAVQPMMLQFQLSGATTPAVDNSDAACNVLLPHAGAGATTGSSVHVLDAPVPSSFT